MVCDNHIVTYVVYSYIVLFNRLRKGKMKMVLGEGQYYFVSLCEELCGIQLTFLLHGKNHSAKQRQELFQYILSKIELLMDGFMQASTKPKAYIPCYYQDCTSLHVEVELLCDGEHQHCPIIEKPLPHDYYCDLFSDQSMYTFNYCIYYHPLSLFIVFIIESVESVQSITKAGRFQLFLLLLS